MEAKMGEMFLNKGLKSSNNREALPLQKKNRTY